MMLHSRCHLLSPMALLTAQTTVPASTVFSVSLPLTTHSCLEALTIVNKIRALACLGVKPSMCPSSVGKTRDQSFQGPREPVELARALVLPVPHAAAQPHWSPPTAQTSSRCFLQSQLQIFLGLIPAYLIIQTSEAFPESPPPSKPAVSHSSSNGLYFL